MSRDRRKRVFASHHSSAVALSSPNELFACQLRIRKLYLGLVKPIFEFVNTELNNVSCLYENEDDEDSILNR
jgi:hypothetical protein